MKHDTGASLTLHSNTGACLTLLLALNLVVCIRIFYLLVIPVMSQWGKMLPVAFFGEKLPFFTNNQ